MELNITVEELCRAEFKFYGGNPILTPFDGSFVVADPSLLTPEESSDNRWHMFFHTNFGVWSFSGDDGISFKKEKKLVKNAMRPNINLVNGVYYLFYESTRSPAANALTLTGLAKWKSEIRVIKSRDLKVWSKPETVIPHTRPFEEDKRGVSISNPFFLTENGVCRLYYSCGQTFIPDNGFCEPTYISYAESDNPGGGYVSAEKPIISPDENSRYFNLCSGCLKVYKLKDGYAGIQNGLFKENGKCHSAIMLLTSRDGKCFDFVRPLVKPGDDNGKKWMKEFVYASHLVRCGDSLRLYFNARDLASPIKGREGIGFCEAKI